MSVKANTNLQQPNTCRCSVCIVYMFMFRPYARLSFYYKVFWRPSSWWKATENDILGWHQVVPSLGLLQSFHVWELPVLLISQWLILACCSWEYKQPNRLTKQVKYMYMVVSVGCCPLLTTLPPMNLSTYQYHSVNFLPSCMFIFL